MQINKRIHKDVIGSYTQDDVVFLLKDLTNMIKEQNNIERERLIQSGKHYSEMLPVEYEPSQQYMDLFYSALKTTNKKLAIATGVVSERIIKDRGTDIVLVSLARAGTPAGILIKRYIKYVYNLDIPHYSISIIRDRGIDENALLYIISHHPNSQIQFVDGWTGKGAITKELIKACDCFYNKHQVRLDQRLAVIADPGYCTTQFGTREDFLIPSACLNSTVSGLISRTVLRKDLIGDFDFHGVKVYKELEDNDVSNYFIENIVRNYSSILPDVKKQYLEIENENKFPTWQGLKDVQVIQKDFEIKNINHIKPGIGETTRVLLRRIPYKILINKSSEELSHIFQLAKEKGIEIIEYPLIAYKCCGIIKNLRNQKNAVC